MKSVKIDFEENYPYTPLVINYSGSKKMATSLTLRADYKGAFAVGDTFGFQYNTSASASGATDVEATNVSASHYFYANVAGLTASTKYYYRTWIMVSGGSKVYNATWGDFTMNAAMTASNSAATDITSTEATINGAYTNKYPGVLFDKVGFYVNTSQSESGATTVENATVETPFSYDLTELTANTTYYFKSYVKSTTESITVKASTWQSFGTLES